MEVKTLEIGWLIITGVVILLPIIYGLIKKKDLPEKIATHFSIDGVPNGWSPKWVVIFGLPLSMAALQAIIYIVLCLCNVAAICYPLAAVIMLIVPVVEYISMAVIYSKVLKK